jgi:hypothetical protein
MKGGEEMVTKTTDSTSKIQEVGGSGVFKDMIEEKETDEVKETRDKYYRVLREADKYLVTVSGFKKPTGDNDEEDLSEEAMLIATAVKKTPLNLNAKEDILQTKDYSVVLVQDAKDFELDITSQLDRLATGNEIDENDTILFQIERDYTPKFLIEKYIRKAVIKKHVKKNSYCLDLYFSIYTRQFWKIDSLFIAELKRVYDTQNKRSEMFDFKSLSFVTTKAAGAEELHNIKCVNKGLSKIEIFDGNYVVEFEVDYENTDATAKYQTQELTEKYAAMSPKSNVANAYIMEKMMKDEKLKEIKEDKTE